MEPKKTSFWYSLIEPFHYHIEVYSFKWALRDRDRICNGHVEQIYEHFPELSHQCKVQAKFWPCTNCEDESTIACMIAQTPLGAKNLIFLFIGFIHTKKEIRFCICHDTLPKAEALFPGKQYQITSGSSIRISLHLSLDIKQFMNEFNAYAVSQVNLIFQNV